jgi:hypothetical protein
MAFEIRVPAEEEAGAVFRVNATAFGHEHDPERVGRSLRLAERQLVRVDAAFAAADGGG